ncbi:hypothetical protein VNO78_21015 [Psophocarpus tetragonolobus]|uniref:DUF4378 domain-containing protein n=1 Tax=Psophocarpus tetragonolobus TaxID=3891 RepID=A0AAN9XHA0_PSOTE
MVEKHLRELLSEDQEPFHLKHYISERRRQLRRPSPNTTLQRMKNKFPLNKCFLQKARKSPLASPKKSPLRPSNAKTAAVLLEAALKIKKYSKAKPNKASGLLGSVLKRLTSRKREDDDVGVGEVVGSYEAGFTCSCNGRPSSAVWSETNEDKSLDMETCSSAHSFDEDIHFLNHHAFFSPSPFQPTPSHTTPPPSPTPHNTQDKEINGADGVNKFQSGEDEEDKEQCSPVSVLDPPFDDDDDENDYDGEHGFDMDCSYANVQRTKQHLLDRLRRFEKLAELDPVELEKRMLDQEDCEYETFMEEDDDVDNETTSEENGLGEKVFEILCHASVQDIQQTPEDLKRLVYDLIKEEETEVNSSEESNMVVIRRVCRRLDLWKEVESNTIDMMIEEDFSREEGRWKKNAEHTGELAGELELAIFGLLVDELSEELVC